MSEEITFGMLNKDGTISNVRTLLRASIAQCPHVILAAEHYREDGTCRCDDPTHSEMAEWDYAWNGEKWV